MTFPAKVVVITGASAGIGRATVREFARHGASIGLIARGEDGLEAALAEVEELGGRALVLTCDVSDPQAVDAAAERVEQELGPIDVWVNNAMVTVFSPFKDMNLDEFQRVTDVTYMGVVNGTHAALKRMLPRDRGVIVQVGSALAYRSIPLQSAYCGAKAAIRGFTDSLRSELLHDQSQVHLTMVQMPALNTPQFDWGHSHMDHRAQPVPPIYQPEVAARAIYWASQHREREVDVGFSTLKAVIGTKLIPGLLDRYLAKAAYDGQLLPAADHHDRPDNLWHPVKGDHGAHGSFDGKARSRSLELWLAEHKKGLAAVGLGIASLALLRRAARLAS